jgi:mRNA-degrading endonuclease RelE of RelBE toxin-antitoxin system
MDRVKWYIERPRASFIKFFESHATDRKWLRVFEQDVTTDPRHHPSPKRIRLIKREDLYPDGTYRWRKADVRIVYLVTEPPETARHTVWPLDANTASSIRYKKL